MRWRLLPGICLVLAVIAVSAVGCAGVTPPSAPKAESWSGFFSQQTTGIWVSGTGEVTVTPDIASLEVGIEVQEVSVGQAMDKASEAMDKVMNTLTEKGVAEKDIRTRRFRVRQRTSWDDQRQQEVIIGYRVTNTVTAKVRDVDETGTIIDAVARAGGDYIRINSISFTVDDPTAYHEEAREKAMADAEAKAKQLADLSDVKLGKISYISEGGLAPVPRALYVETMPMPAPAAAPTPISPGETEIRLSVQVAYSIE